jgi:hypothetical protein
MSRHKLHPVAKLSVLERAYDEQLAIFKQNPQEADKLLAIGEKKRNPKLPALEHAALDSGMPGHP